MPVSRCNEQKKADFLQKLREGVPILKAAAQVDVPHMTLYNRRKTDEKFDQAWKDALAEGEKVTIARLEQEADRRAIEGYEKPIYQGGELVGSEQRYSDTLLMFRLNGLASDRYRQRSEVALQADVTINVVEQYREATREADELRAQAEAKRLNGSKSNGHATNGNGRHP